MFASPSGLFRVCIFIVLSFRLALFLSLSLVEARNWIVCGIVLDGEMCSWIY